MCQCREVTVCAPYVSYLAVRQRRERAILTAGMVSKSGSGTCGKTRGGPHLGGGEMELCNEVLKDADAVIEAILIEVAPPP